MEFSIVPVKGNAHGMNSLKKYLDLNVLIQKFFLAQQMNLKDPQKGQNIQFLEIICWN